MDKLEKKVHLIKMYNDNWYDQTDEDGNIIRDEKGEPIKIIDIWSYCIFFAQNVQNMIGGLPDGLSLQQFSNEWDFSSNENQLLLNNFMSDNIIYDFQEELENKGIKINAFALYTLCCFVARIVKQKFLIRLKPSLKETLSEVKKIKSVVIKNEDGTTHETSHSKIINAILDVLQDKEDSTYEAYDIVLRQEVFKDVVQAEFTIYMADFFNKYFIIDRKEGTTVTASEQRIICYFLRFFNLAKNRDIEDNGNTQSKRKRDVVSSRFRQFKNNKAAFYNSQVFIRGPKGLLSNLPVGFIKYTDWKSGHMIDLSKHDLQVLEKDEGITFDGDFMKKWEKLIKDKPFYKC